MDEVGQRLTRLRRRLSVENEDIVSSPATPTKQRMRKLLKPALEDITENAIVDSPKRKIRNSLASESTVTMDTVSPGKITRARANSSLQSESIQAVASPRVLRATRRNSFAGNDTDTSAVLTPVRRSRRISKEYNKSPETLVALKVSAKKARRGSTATKDVTLEENDDEKKVIAVSSPKKKTSPDSKITNGCVKSSDGLNDSSPGSMRKSPRLSVKKNTSGADQQSFEKSVSNEDKSRYHGNKSSSDASFKKKVSLADSKEDKSCDNLEPILDCKNKSFENLLKSPVASNGDNIYSPRSTQNSHRENLVDTSDKNNIDLDSSIQKKDNSLSEFINNKHSIITSTIVFEDIEESELSNKENNNCEASKKDNSIVSMEVDITMPDLVPSNSKTNSPLVIMKNKSFEKSSEIVVVGKSPEILISKSIEENTSDIKDRSRSTNLNQIDKNRSLNAEHTKNSPAREKTSGSGVFTSTPVQQNIKQQAKEIDGKLLKQKKIPESANEASSSEDEDDDKKITLVESEASDAGSDYKSGDSQDESERKYAEENEIPVKGETLDSDEEDSDDTDYEKDSFVVSSDEEDDELLSGSGDDLSLSDKELKMTKKSKEKYNKRKVREQKRASKEMFEARHGNSNENTKAEESDDPDIIFASKNKSKNRMRFDSSREISDAKIDEQEISILANISQSDKDPLITNMSIKKEIFDVTANNETLGEAIENVTVAENVTIITNKEEKNPLESIVGENKFTDSESSDDDGISGNYSALLNNLNKCTIKNNPKSDDKSTNNKLKQIEKKINLSLSEVKQKYKNNDSVLDKLNITQSGKEKKILKSSKHYSFNEKEIIESELSTTNHTFDNNQEKGNDNYGKSPRKHPETQNKETEVATTLEANDDFKYKKSRKRNLSLNESKADKAKDASIINKLNLTNSGKEKKVKLNVQTEITKKCASNVNPDCSSNDSGDAFDFKLMFMQDGDSDTDQKAMEIDENIHEHNKNKAKIYPSPAKQLSKSEELKDEESHLIDKPKAATELKEYEDENNTMKKKKKSKLHKQNVEVSGETKGQQTDEEISRKRKNKDNINSNNNKVYLTSSENKIKVTKLPQSIIEKLEHIPKTEPLLKINKIQPVIATSNFEVEHIKLKKNKPSHYLEESVYIDKSPVVHSNNSKMLKKPKVLPSVPKAKTSADGCTSNFKVKILKKHKRHDEVENNVVTEIVNFKTQRLYGTSIKRIAAEELCRKNKKAKFNRF